MSQELSQSQIDALKRVGGAFRLRDADMVEDALTHIFSAGLHPQMAPILIALVEAPWHTRHEDVVEALQLLRSPDAVEILERVALTSHAYLDYDEFYGLARKCTWALADIGTPAAHEALERLAGTTNTVIADYARKRIVNWNEERYRKAT